MLAGSDPSKEEVHLYRWIDYTRPAHKLIAAARVPEPERLTERSRRTSNSNWIIFQTYPCVRDGLAAGRVGIHGWLYDMENGTLSAYDPQTGEWRDLLAASASSGRV